MNRADHENLRRWHLILGDTGAEPSARLQEPDQRLAAALDALYGGGDAAGGGDKRRGGLGRSAPRVARWLGDIRSFFPTPVVQIMQRDAFERLGLQQMLLQPEFLSAVTADIHLVADLMTLSSVMPDKTRETARDVIRKVVDELMARLAQRTAEAVRGAVNRAHRTSRPRFADIDWNRTLRANLQHYQAEYQSVVPEKLVGFRRHQRRLVDLDEVVLCVDQSGSMATSVVYASIFAAVMASLPVVSTRLVCFDTTVVDLTDQLADPVEVLFGVQLGGGTDINQAVAYCEDQITRPTKSHFVLITDLYEGGDAEQLLLRIGALKRSGVNVIVLLALSDDGTPSYSEQLAQQIAGHGIPVFGCTPDQFPDLMAAALDRRDIQSWAATEGIKVTRGNV